MKNLRGVIGIILLSFMLQVTVVSCTNDTEIIKNENAKQTQKQTRMVDPAHAGGEADENREGN